jgi:hypothetical protein
MPAAWATTPAYFLVFAFLCGAVGFRLGWRFHHRVALLAAQSAFGWMAFLLAWAMVGTGWAAVSVGAWALGTTFTSIYVFLGHPAEADERVIRAAAYRASMLRWLESGEGPDAHPRAILLRHAREAIWYTAAAIATANLASIAMGAFLLNEMNAYVATLLRAGKRTGRVLLLSWNVWSIVRVVAYVMIGAAASAPLLRLAGWRVDEGAVRTLAIAGAAGLALDVVLKLTLRAACGRALRPAVDLAAAKSNRSSEAPLALHLD